MQHLCSTLCGLLASCLCSWGFSDLLSVIQSPTSITLNKGDEIRIICSWNISIALGTKVKWIKDHQKIQLNKTDPKFTNFLNDSCAVLIINSADVTDAGFYMCNVTQDIPQLRCGNGNGTNIINDGKNDSVSGSTRPGSTTSPQNTERSSGAAVGASASVAAVLLFVCVCLSVWKMKRRHTQSERTVIREGPQSEGEEPGNSEEGGSSRTSRGSTEWYMVPVYESYFDLQRSDDQKFADFGDESCGSTQK